MKSSFSSLTRDTYLSTLKDASRVFVSLARSGKLSNSIGGEMTAAEKLFTFPSLPINPVTPPSPFLSPAALSSIVFDNPRPRILR